MYTLFGQEAKDGDYVLIHDIQATRHTANIYIAKVEGNKAYSTAIAPVDYHSKYRWIRKQSAIVVLPESEVPKLGKALIEMNILAERATFESGTDYYERIMAIVDKYTKEMTEEKVRKYGEEYRYR